MNRLERTALALLVPLLLVAHRPAHAQLAVVDIPATVQLVQEVEATVQQVQTAENQLAQARQALATMTGRRGMEMLLAGIVRNYLPTSWAQLQGAMQGAPGGLSGAVRDAIAANAVLSGSQLAALPTVSRQRVLAGRHTSALGEALTQQALVNASGRFATLQSLIDAIGSATDQKAILELQARINAELGMLQNEQTKLQVLLGAARAHEAIDRQQGLEQVIAGHGRFTSRFQPVPGAAP